MYRFEYQKNEKLPALAWLAEIDPENSRIVVFCGEKVETFPTFFAAGVWDGAFEQAGFDASETFYGTGAKLTEDGARFATPSHALERLVLHRGEKTVVSNSVPFLLSYRGLSLDRRIDQYERLMCSILDGPKKMTTRIPLKGGQCFEQYIVSWIDVDGGGEIRVSERPKVRPFESFEDYYTRLMKAMYAVRDNANAEARACSRYGLISTLSSGYDSSTCAAVARELGCETVASLCGGQYEKDDGREIARQLGYKDLVRRDMYAYRELPGLVDAEFVCGGEMGTMLQFVVFEDAFRDKLVFFGLRGSYWAKSMGMTDEHEMIGYFNCEADVSITEYALRDGFIMIPLPTFGSSACSSINRISNSEEMKPWTLGTAYDKPIPRRVLETKGVQRETFGQIKRGGGFSLYRDNKKRLSRRMSVEGYRDFERYLREKKGVRGSLGRGLRAARFVAANLPTYFNHAMRLAHLSPRWKQKPIRLANPGAVANLFFWGVDVVGARYAEAMRASQQR